MLIAQIWGFPAADCPLGISAATQNCCCPAAAIFDGETDVAKPAEIDVIETSVSEYPLVVLGAPEAVAMVGDCAV
jgi:hypothetical protein